MTEQRDLHWIAWLTVTTLLLLLSWLPLALLGGRWNLVMEGSRLAILFFVGWYGLRQAVVSWPNPAVCRCANLSDRRNKAALKRDMNVADNGPGCCQRSV